MSSTTTTTTSSSGVHDLELLCKSKPDIDILIRIYDYLCTYGLGLAKEGLLPHLLDYIESIGRLELKDYLQHSEHKLRLHHFLDNIPDTHLLAEHLEAALANLQTLCHAADLPIDTLTSTYFNIRMMLCTEACIYNVDNDDEWHEILDQYFSKSDAVIKRGDNENTKQVKKLLKSRRHELEQYYKNYHSADSTQQAEAEEFKKLYTRKNTNWDLLKNNLLNELHTELQLNEKNKLDEWIDSIKQQRTPPVKSTRSSTSASSSKKGQQKLAAAQPVSDDDEEDSGVKIIASPKVVGNKRATSASSSSKKKKKQESSNTSSSSINALQRSRDARNKLNKTVDDPLSQEKEKEKRSKSPVSSGDKNIEKGRLRKGNGVAVSKVKDSDSEEEDGESDKENQDGDSESTQSEAEDGEDDTVKVFGSSKRTYGGDAKASNSTASTSTSSQSMTGGLARRINKYDVETSDAEKVEFGDEDQEIHIEDTKNRLFSKKRTAMKASLIDSSADEASPVKKRVGNKTGYGVAPTTGLEHHRAIPKKVRQPWGANEIHYLTVGMTEFAQERDKFAKTLNIYGEHFNDRTTVDLKDKWRNIQKKRKQALSHSSKLPLTNKQAESDNEE